MTVLIRRITALLSLVGLASTQTLYYVSQIAQPTTEFVHQTVSLSAVGVGADGATTYVETGVDSYIAIGYSDATETVLSTPHAFTVTFVEDASSFRESLPFPGGEFVESCAFGGDGLGACVINIPGGPSSTATRTISGTVVPWITIAAAAATTPAPSASATGKPNGASLPTSLTVGHMAIFAFVALFHM